MARMASIANVAALFLRLGLGKQTPMDERIEVLATANQAPHPQSQSKEVELADR